MEVARIVSVVVASTVVSTVTVMDTGVTPRKLVQKESALFAFSIPTARITSTASQTTSSYIEFQRRTYDLHVCQSGSQQPSQ